MKRFINVSTRTADGRTITQRYPARSVGKRPSGALGAVDFTCLKCGYIVCECPDGGWPPPIALEPPADVLPEGWTRGGADLFWYGEKLLAAWEGTGGTWHWCRYKSPASNHVVEAGHQPTRDAAMAAALASVQPVEPTLRAGWAEIDGVIKHAGSTARRFLYMAGGWVDLFRDGSAAINERESRDTLEAAMLRAEAIARGEP